MEVQRCSQVRHPGCVSVLHSGGHCHGEPWWRGHYLEAGDERSRAPPTETDTERVRKRSHVQSRPVPVQSTASLVGVFTVICLFSSACVHLEWCPLWTASCSCSIGQVTESWKTEASWSHRRLAVSAFGASLDRHKLMVSGRGRGRMDAGSIIQNKWIKNKKTGI